MIKLLLVSLVLIALVSCKCKHQPVCKTNTEIARAIFSECVAAGIGRERSVNQCRIAAQKLSQDCSEQTGKESGQESNAGF